MGAGGTVPPSRSVSRVDWPARTRIKMAAEARLRRAGNSVVTGPDQVARFHRQVDAVLDEVADGVAEQVRPADRRPGAPAAGVRGPGRVLPSESLEAAEVVFEVSLEVLVSLSPAQPCAQVVGLTAALHRASMRCFGDGAVAYADLLLRRVQDSQREERLRLARELHDRPAHALAVAQQNLELYAEYRDDEPDRAVAWMAAARECLREAFGSIRTVAGDLREALAGRDVGVALADYLARRVPPPVRTSLTVEGDCSRLPGALAEELYLVLREAVLNSLRHAEPSAIDVRVEVRDAVVAARVQDDGTGFEPGRADGIGLASMRERLELLGGSLDVISAEGLGSGVRAAVPLPSRPG